MIRQLNYTGFDADFGKTAKNLIRVRALIYEGKAFPRVAGRACVLSDTSEDGKACINEVQFRFEWLRRRSAG